MVRMTEFTDSNTKKVAIAYKSKINTCENNVVYYKLKNFKIKNFIFIEKNLFF